MKIQNRIIPPTRDGHIGQETTGIGVFRWVVASTPLMTQPELSLPDDQLMRFIFFSLTATTLFAGCTPWTTRYPTVLPSEPRSERREFQRYDPFTVTDMGPDTMVRPRDYSTPRTRERSDAEEKYRRGFGGGTTNYGATNYGVQQPYYPTYGMPAQPMPMGF